MKGLRSLVICLLCLSIGCTAQKDSLQKTYDKNGNLVSVGLRVNELKQGEWKYYDSLGNIKKIINYSDNLFHGVYKEFHPNSSLKISGFYDRNFVSEEFAEDGAVAKYAIRLGSWDYFDNKGKLIKTEVYDCTGRIIKTLQKER